MHTAKMLHGVPIVPVEKRNRVSQFLCRTKIDEWTNLEVNECFNAQECTEIAKTGGDGATEASKF